MESSSSQVFNFSRAPLAQQRMLLPIYKHKRQILYTMEHYGVICIVGETGSGYVLYTILILHVRDCTAKFA